MPALKGKAVVAQSGGPTAVINASAAGVIQTCLANQDVFTGVYGSLNGILGTLQEELFDLAVEDPIQIDRLKRSPSSALGSCRHKLKDLEADRADYERILEVFKAHDVRYFFYIGGNDSMDTAAKLGRLAGETDYEMIAMGVPKTIDNDLACTDHCPGYGSVAKYSATSVMESGRDTSALYTHDTCTVHEVMGRNAGWIAASTGLVRRSEQDAPHIILLPEVPFVIEKFVADVQRSLTDYKQCFITCGEGVKTPDGQYLADAGGQFVKDSFGHTQLGGAGEAVRAIVESHVGVKARTNLPGTAQRVAMHFASKTDADEAYMAGQAAVTAAMEGVSGKMVTLVRNDDAGPYACTTGLADLEDVANGEKMLPPEFINESGTGVTEAFIQYARPLIQGAAPLDISDDGLPLYACLDRTLVAKLTPAWR
ncbi:MAG: 6-phosphofructokinase [Phycisphaerae bacterium]|jgi:6-phosphofructokinase 1|nr:6-phosphofructokinase [Phycisphaerae bacterium]